jgi:uncharacterized protein YacL
MSVTAKSFAALAAAIFALVAVVQLLRIAMGWAITFNGTPIPFWPSAIAVVVAALLAIVGFRAARD